MKKIRIHNLVDFNKKSERSKITRLIISKKKFQRLKKIKKILEEIIGLKDVSINNGCYLNVSYGKSLNNNFKNKKVGETIILKSEKEQIKFTINKINYVYSNIEISIHK
ncbi:hypothetical protein [Empedobacter brevis]|uniref:hypothetical protein n=1 Tax=Empedobacter brevis TaxID=247 RepID=UPI00333FCBF6